VASHARVAAFLVLGVFRYYNNVLSIPPTLALGLAFREFDEIADLEWSVRQVSAVLLSYAGFNLRKQVTATSFTVIGVLCKVASVLLNIFIWDKHANAVGIAALCICILAGTFYQQSGKA
jgi:GDP-mannose transporter